jgi:MCM AAA-lid domain
MIVIFNSTLDMRESMFIQRSAHQLLVYCRYSLSCLLESCIFPEILWVTEVIDGFCSEKCAYRHFYVWRHARTAIEEMSWARFRIYRQTFLRQFYRLQYLLCLLKLYFITCLCFQEFYLDLRKNHQTADSTPITTRQLESLIRLTEVLAQIFKCWYSVCTT